MFKVGEKVRYLDDVGEATIIKIVDTKTVILEDEYGLTHPHPINKLVPAERDHVPSKPAVSVPISEAPKPTPQVKISHTASHPLPELSLVFASTNTNKPESGDLDLLFCNNSKYHLLINVAAKENEEWFSLYHGEINPKSDQLIQSLRRQDVGSVSNLSVDVVFFAKAGYEYRKSISCTAKVKATRFVKSGNYQLYEGIENPAIAIPVEQERIVPVQPPAAVARKALKQVQKPTLPIHEEEIDLHLEEILGTDPMDMPDHEKFLTQMRHFERKLNHALTHRYVQITFIHGVGTGRLKEAIRQELSEYGLPFEDGPFHKYGVGATVVRLH